MNVGKSACAFITGAGSGVGRALALGYAARGLPMALLDISTERLEESAQLAREAGAAMVTTHCCDVSISEEVTNEVTAAIAQHGGVRYLIANAGVGFAIPLSQASQDDIRWVFGVNYFGVCNTVMAMLPYLKATNTPINVAVVSSMSAVLTPPGWNLGIYSGAKFAVCALAQGLRDDLIDVPVDVSVIYPGVIKTGLTANSRAMRPGTGHGESKIPAAFMNAGMDVDRAANIMIAAIDRGMPDIFTHPEDVTMLQAYVEKMEAGFAQSAALLKEIS